MAAQYDESYSQEGPARAKPVPLALDEAELRTLAELVEGEYGPPQIRIILGQQEEGLRYSLRLADFQRFLYFCHAKNLNPLLNEIHLDYRWDKDTSSAKCLFVTHIDGYRKLADMTGQYDGSETVFGEKTLRVGAEEKAATVPEWAETTVWRKDAGHPFKARCYAVEFLGTSYTHRKMPRVILGKDSEAAALRRAFPAALSGAYLQEELDVPTLLAPTEPNGEQGDGDGQLHVGGYAIGKKPEAAPEAPEEPAQPEGQPVQAEPAPKAEAAPKRAPKAKAPAPPAPPPPNPAQEFAARRAKIAEATDTNHVQAREFFRGWFGGELPQNPEAYGEPLTALEALVKTPEGVERYKANAKEAGEGMRRRQQSVSARNGKLAKTLQEKFEWSEATAALAARYCEVRDAGLKDFVGYLEAVEMSGAAQEDVSDFLRLAIRTREAHRAARAVRAGSYTFSWVIGAVQERLGKPLDDMPPDSPEVEKALMEALTEPRLGQDVSDEDIPF